VCEKNQTRLLSAGCDDFVRKPLAEEIIFDTLPKHLGVKYILDEISSPKFENPAKSLLTSLQLTIMPEKWITKLYEAALEPNTNLVLQLVK
jgi:hypothetical protein